MATSNVDVVVFALTQLGGAEDLVHTEEIAMTCSKLDAENFAWTLPRYHNKGLPDKEVAIRALRSAKRRKLVQGTSNRNVPRDGWMLTEAGLKWIRQNGQRMARQLKVKTTLDVAESLDRGQLHRRLEGDPLFRLYVDTGSLEDADRDDVARVLDVSPYSPPEQIQDAYVSLQTRAALARDNDVVTFLRAIEPGVKLLVKEREAATKS